ncbi:MAG: TRAP transporter large permease [Oscillibacter sp.]|nr:TRAP transporter large permease [Oscillibacter sp.]
MIVGIAFVVTIVIGMPIAFALGATGLVHAISMGQLSLFATLPQRMYAACNSTSLMAIPLFILAGELMGVGGVTERLCDMARSFIGHVRGGMAYVTVIVGALLGALLGSANASAALLGRVMKPELDKDNYDPVFSTSLCAATSILGPIIPPSAVFIVYGVQASCSVGSLFFAGVIPGITLALAFMGIIFASSRKEGEKWTVRAKCSLREIGISCLRALPALIVPVIILGGILAGAFTPTESAAIASLVALLLGMFVFKKLKLKDVPEILENTAIISGAIMIIVAMANILGYTMSLAQLPQAIANALLSITSSKILLLLLINVFLLVVGCVMETFAALIILVPVFLPVALSLGLTPIHFGMIMCINLIVGLITPPVGVALFTTSLATNVPLNKLIGPIWKWVGVSVVVLMLVTFIPAMSNWLPSLLG